MKPIVLLLLVFFFASCDSYETDKFVEIPIEVDGIKLTEANELFTYEADIEASGCMFGIRTKGFETIARTLVVETNESHQIIKSQFREEAPYEDSHPLTSDGWGRWGEVTYYYNVTPYVIMFDIEANKTDELRHFTILIGGGYSYVRLKITQAAAMREQ